MLRCSKCGEYVPDGNVFCTKCGVSIKKTCPKCNSPINPGNEFCNTCGSPLSETAAPKTNIANPATNINPVPVAMPMATPIAQPVAPPAPQIQYVPNTQPAYQPAMVQPYIYQPVQQATPVQRNRRIRTKPEVARYSPLTFIMYTVSFIYLLVPFFPTYEIGIPFIQELNGEIKILDALMLGDLGLDLDVIVGFHIFILVFFAAAMILNIISLICMIRHKDRIFWLLLALSGIVSLVGTIIWMLEWGAIQALLRSNYITYLVAEIISPTFYLYCALITALFMIIFSFIRRKRSYNF